MADAPPSSQVPPPVSVFAVPAPKLAAAMHGATTVAAPPKFTVTAPAATLPSSSTSSSASAPASSSAPLPQRVRRKVPLAPGHTMLDWQRLPVSLPVASPHRVTLDELARHASLNDCWMAINGRVYDLTPYLPFHPGGEAELMRAAGRDATALVRETHAWVNIEAIAGKCCVGVLDM